MVLEQGRLIKVHLGFMGSCAAVDVSTQCFCFGRYNEMGKCSQNQNSYLLWTGSVKHSGTRSPEDQLSGACPGIQSQNAFLHVR